MHVRSPILLMLCAAMTASLTGCQVASNALHNTCFEWTRACSDCQEDWALKSQASAAWDAARGSSKCSSADFADGFKDGYIDFLKYGGNGKAPYVPPRKYWHSRFRTPEGYLAASDWFAGFSHGSATARESNGRRWNVLPSRCTVENGGDCAACAPPPITILPPMKAPQPLPGTQPLPPLWSPPLPGQPSPVPSPLPSGPVPSDTVPSGKLPTMLPPLAGPGSTTTAPVAQVSGVMPPPVAPMVPPVAPQPTEYPAPTIVEGMPDPGAVAPVPAQPGPFPLPQIIDLSIEAPDGSEIILIPRNTDPAPPAPSVLTPAPPAPLPTMLPETLPEAIPDARPATAPAGPTVPGNMGPASDVKAEPKSETSPETRPDAKTEAIAAPPSAPRLVRIRLKEIRGDE